MIDFTTDKQNLLVRIKYGKEIGDWTLTATVDKGHEVNAKLTAHHFHEKLNEVLRRLREEVYTQGWKDAKAKREKRKWFSAWW